MEIVRTSKSRFTANWIVSHEGKIYVRSVNLESGKIRWSEIDNDGDWLNIGVFAETLESTFSGL